MILNDKQIKKLVEKGKIGNFYNIGSNINLRNIQISKLLLKIAKKNFLRFSCFSVKKFLYYFSD